MDSDTHTHTQTKYCNPRSSWTNGLKENAKTWVPSLDSALKSSFEIPLQDDQNEDPLSLESGK